MHRLSRFMVGRGAVHDEQQRELAEYQQKLSMAGNVYQPQGQSGKRQAAIDGMRNDIKVTVDDRNSVQKKLGDTLVGNITLDEQNFAHPPATTLGESGDILMFDSTRSMAGAAVPTAPAGLASLDFELPTDKNLYELYRFTTPRGEAELTARTVSNSTLSRLELLLGFAAAGLLVWAAFWLIRRGTLAWFRRPLGAVLLAVAGLASLCGGLLPFAGLIALLDRHRLAGCTFLAAAGGSGVMRD